MEDSTFKILVTTDNHLGFAERDPRRGDDSFTTFEEVLRAARTEHDVDAMLLGGDLFHENKPSLGCLVRTCSLFRKYVFGSKAIPFSLLSDPATNFPTHAVPLANFQDPNINVALPVFAIHGNHDDPVGGTSSLDLLATNGYVNYLGHISSLEDIVVEPVLLRKGNTFVALYGLGNVRDERLHRCFRLKKVQFVYPKPVPGRRWFNILLLHQNRGVRGTASKNGILEGMLAGFGMDLLIWGNEHEQLMVPQPALGFDIVQPGSTIMTSLSAQECNPKQYGILEIRGTAYRLTPYNLRSVRPVVRRTVELRQDLPEGRTLDAVETFLHGVMVDVISEAEEQVRRIPDDVLAFHPNVKYPLIRLAVDFTDVTSAPYPQPNLNRFGQQYMDVVANPGEMLRPVKPKPERRTTATASGGTHMAGGGAAVPAMPQLSTLDIRSKVADVFNHNTKNACTLLSEAELSAAVYAFAEKGERDAIDERLMELLHTSQKSVWRRLENGANALILKPDRVVEEVILHKRQINERYARAVQLEDAQMQQEMADEEADEEAAGEGVPEDRGSRRGDAPLMTSTMVTSPHLVKQGTEPNKFERARVAVPLGGDDDRHSHDGCRATLPLTSVATLVQRVIQQSKGKDSGGVRTGAGEMGDADEDEGEELPADGLDRIPIEHMVAQAVRLEVPDQPSRRPPAKRMRAADLGSVTAKAGESSDRIDQNDNGDDIANIEDTQSARLRGTGTYAASPLTTAVPAKRQRTVSARRGRGGGAAGRSIASAVEGAGGGNGAVSGGGPTLMLVPRQGASTTAARSTPPPSPSSAHTTSPTAAVDNVVQQLISKWSGTT